MTRAEEIAGDRLAGRRALVRAWEREAFVDEGTGRRHGHRIDQRVPLLRGAARDLVGLVHDEYPTLVGWLHDRDHVDRVEHLVGVVRQRTREVRGVDVVPERRTPFAVNGVDPGLSGEAGRRDANQREERSRESFQRSLLW